MRGLVAVVVLFALFLPPAVTAEDSVESEIRAAVEAYYAHTREYLKNPTDALSRDGSLQFWSSGGLMLSVDADTPPVEYESFAVRPKHITVAPLGDGSAVAMYYAEGSMQPKGRPVVGHYLTRVLAVYVKEDGTWKVRAGHWSPLVGGGGTSR